MQRDIHKLSTDQFDILIIGGGISGAAIAWDAALRGYKTALIEKKDFGHGTSAATSKLIHGGLRYLAQYDFPVVRESLRERRLLEQNIPHQAFPLPFLLPIYDYFKTPRWMLAIGLTLYDILSFDKNRLKDKSKHLRNKKWYSRQEALAMEPGLDPNGLQGAYLYYDVINLHPERSNFDFVQSAAEQGATVANYVSFRDFIIEESATGKRVSGVIAADETTQKTFPIRATVTVNAGGPWGDLILSKLHKNPVRQLVRSKGIHLLFRKFHGDHAITFETRDNRHFFIIPWLDYTLVGTTDTPFNEDPDKIRVTEQDAQEFIDLINAHYPANLTLKDVVHSYAGIRPLVAESGVSSTYKASRRHEIVNHKKAENIDGLISVFGGKWTTSRSLAQEAVNTIAALGKFQKKKCLTKITPLSAGRVGDSWEQFCAEAHRKYDALYGEKTIKRLLEIYGAHYSRVLEIMAAKKNMADVLDPATGVSRAEVYHAVKNEMALTLDDFLMRRSGIGNYGAVAEKSLQNITAEMGKLLKWNSARQRAEIKSWKDRQKLARQ